MNFTNGCQYHSTLKYCYDCRSLNQFFCSKKGGGIFMSNFKILTKCVIRFANDILKSTLTRIVIFTFCLGILLSGSIARVYAAPNIGQELNLIQPDGTFIKVKAFGDEFYTWLETIDGNVVFKDPKTQIYYYAQTSSDGDEYESTGIVLGTDSNKLTKSQSEKISQQKKVRISNKAAENERANARKLLHRDENGAIAQPDIQMAPTTDGSITTVASATTATTSTDTSTHIYGTRNGLVLLAGFPDRPQDVTVSQDTVNSYFNDIPYTGGNSATSVRGYFKIQSNNKLDIYNTITPWFSAPNNLSYYNVPTPDLWYRFNELIIYRLVQLKAEGFDFSQLDENKDGCVDNVSLLYAGGWIVGGWASKIDWSGFADYGLSTSCSVMISPLESTPKLSVVCHELGHSICGFPDLYPYNGNAGTVGNFCLMDSGCHAGNGLHPSNICAPLKYQAGWVSAFEPLNGSVSNFTLDVDGTTVVRYVNPSNSREYFLFEMRGNTRYEGPYGGATTSVCLSQGLVAYHVNETGSNSNSSIITANSPNCDYSKPYRVLVLEDNPLNNTINWYHAPSPDKNDTFEMGDYKNQDTIPNLTFWSGNGRTIDSNISFNNIKVNTSNLTFSIQNNNPPIITATPGIVQVGGSTSLTTEATWSYNYEWRLVSGPGKVTFTNSKSSVTTATFDTLGSYVLGVFDGISNIVSKTTVYATEGLNEYVGNYKSLPVQNNWHIGWIENTGSQLQWRNSAGVKWKLFPGAEKDLFITDATCPYGSGLKFQFIRENEQITKFDFNRGTYTRCTPVSKNSSVRTPLNVDVPINLMAFDVDGDVLTYSIDKQPVNGILMGTLPNITYRPTAGFSGGDCLTFKTVNGTENSNIATVSIFVGNPPFVNAGGDVVTNLTSKFLPGLWYGTVSGNINVTAANPKTALIQNIKDFTEDGIEETTTEIYSGQIYDADGKISFTENIDDKARIWIDGVLKLSDDSWTTRTSTGNLNLTPGWHNIEIRISNGSGGNGPVSSPGIGFDPNGGSAWISLCDPGDGSLLHANETNAVVSLIGATSSQSGYPLFTKWSKVSGPDGERFSNFYEPNTTATFLSNGTYVLRLTAKEDTLSSFDDITVMVGTSNNNPPLAINQNITTNEDTAKAIILSGSDVDGNTLTYSIVTGPSHGSLSGTAPNVTYTPASNYFGTDSFTFKVNDGTNDSALATVDMTVTAVNEAPLAINQNITTNEDTAKAIILSGSDVDGNALTYSIVTGPSHGSLSGSAPNVTYTPASNYFGTDSFTFKVNDGTSDSALAVVALTVTAVNDAPLAINQSITTNEDTAKAIIPSGSDVDGNTLTYSIVTGPSHGSLSGSAPNVTYTPAANYFGTDSFTFKVLDTAGLASQATVLITVNERNRKPRWLQ
jgi:M6 family metalloprotease-like protein